MPRKEEKRFPFAAALLAALFAQAVLVCLLVVSIGGPAGEESKDGKTKSREIAFAAFDLCLRNLRQATDGIDNDGDGETDEGTGDLDDPFDPMVALVLEGQMGRIGMGAWNRSRDENGNGRPDFGEPGVEPFPFSGGEMFTNTVFSERDGLDNDLDGKVDEEDEAGTVDVVAAGRFEGEVSVILYRGLLEPRLATGPKALDGAGLGGAAAPADAGPASCSAGRGTDGSGGAGAPRGGPPASAGLPGIPGADRPMPDGLPGLGQADFVLCPGGKIKDGNGTEIHDACRDGPFRGWSCAQDLWRFRGKGLHPGAVRGIYAVLGDAWIEGTGPALSVEKGGGGGAQAVEMTVIASGEIRMTGNGRFGGCRPDGLLFASGKDIRILGRAGLDQSFRGGFLALGRVVFSGNPDIQGSIVARDALDKVGTAPESPPPAPPGLRDAPAGTAPAPSPVRKRFRFDPKMISYEER